MGIKALIMRVGVAMAGGAFIATTVATAAGASTTAPYIREGSQGSGVTCAQLVLIYTVAPNLNADGIDGPLTTAAVETFQRDYGLSADGIIGPATGTRMYQLSVQLFGSTTCYQYLPTYS
jgi:peptidoglycan hydrolase-like protein with peptidoglycan-binding domain